jgi:hypothetical protein
MGWLFGGDREELLLRREQVEKLSRDLDSANESANNWANRATEYKRLVKRMQMPTTDKGLDEIARVTAVRVEDMFIATQHYITGGGCMRDRRLASVQAVIREVMRANLIGRTDYKGPSEPTYKGMYDGEPPDSSG